MTTPGWVPREGVTAAEPIDAGDLADELGCAQARDDGIARADLAAHRDEITTLIHRLVKHRQRGSDLIYEAYEVDIGGSG